MLDEIDSNDVNRSQGWVASVIRIVIAVVCFAVAWPIANRLQFDRSITSMFDLGDPDLQSYQSLQTDFGGNMVAMLVYRDADLWSTEGIDRNNQVTKAIAEIPGIDGVISPSVLNDLVKKVRPASALSASPPLTNRRDAVARGFDQMFMGYTHSPDHSHGAVVAMLDPDNLKAAIAELRKITSELTSATGSPMQDFVLVGEPVLVEEAFDLIERDGHWLATLTIVLLSLVVLISLFDLRFVFLTIVVIVWSVTITKAVMQTLGMELSLVSTILTALVTVITVTSVLHLGVRYRVARRRGKTPLRSALIAMSLLFIPIVWTCLTDAAGFAALSVSQILPVQQFGWMVTIASLSTLVGLGLWAPTLMALRNPAWIASSKPSQWVETMRSKILEPLQHKLRHLILVIADASVRRPGLIAFTIVLSIGFLATGIGRTETETSFLNNFRPDSEIVSAYNLVETEFGGAGVWDVTIDAPTVVTSSYLKQVRSLEKDLRKIDLNGVHLTKVLSLADADSVVARSGLMRIVSPRVRLGGMRAIMPVFFNALMTTPKKSEPESNTNEKRKLRLMLRSQEDISSLQKIALIREVRSVVQASEIGKTARVTGYYVLMSRLIDQLIRDGWRCFAASSLFVWLLLLVSSRSIVRASIALIINLLPALLVIAGVGWTGGKINMGSAMIAAVSIGLSIDGSVHFLTSYRRKRSRGHIAKVSAVHAAGSVGAAIILATFALVIGFGGLATSKFVPTATFGALVAITLIVGAVVNLTLLPCLVAMSDRS